MLKLILADNQAIFRAGIAKVLAVEDEMRIVAQAQTPRTDVHGAGQVSRRSAGGGGRVS
jgi:DNA-binding NarL/FixJ family response regulator